jgi:hypothetical protein
MQWQYKAYDPSDAAHVVAKNKLMATMWDKTIYLGKRIVEALDGFELDSKLLFHLNP